MKIVIASECEAIRDVTSQLPFAIAERITLVVITGHQFTTLTTSAYEPYRFCTPIGYFISLRS